jgi:hypothetical protein
MEQANRLCRMTVCLSFPLAEPEPKAPLWGNDGSRRSAPRPARSRWGSRDHGSRDPQRDGAAPRTPRADAGQVGRPPGPLWGCERSEESHSMARDSHLPLRAVPNVEFTLGRPLTLGPTLGLCHGRRKTSASD